MTKKEYVKWAEFFDWEFSQYEKVEHYLAEIVHLLKLWVNGESEIENCYTPPLAPEIVEKAKSEYRKENMCSAEEAAAILKNIFGAKK